MSHSLGKQQPVMQRWENFSAQLKVPLLVEGKKITPDAA